MEGVDELSDTCYDENTYKRDGTGKKIHYGMPLRTMLYDGMGYLKEYNEISRMRKGENWGNAGAAPGGGAFRTG